MNFSSIKIEELVFIEIQKMMNYHNLQNEIDNHSNLKDDLGLGLGNINEICCSINFGLLLEYNVDTKYDSDYDLINIYTVQDIIDLFCKKVENEKV